MMVCSSAADCAEIERRHSTGIGLLADGGASRGNLLSGEAEDAILTVSRIDAEKRANPGYRAFLANGFNVTRLLVLYLWEVVLEWTAAARQKRRDVRPARAPRRHLPVPARGDVRVHPRPDRLRRADRHDARAPGGLRDLRQLRRGRPPLRPRARGHARGAAQARPAVRAHRARAPLRPAPVRDRRALRPRPDAGRDVQAAPRLRARRARRALARRSGRVAGLLRRRRAAGRRRPRGRARRPGQGRQARPQRRLRTRRRGARLGQPRPDLPDGIRPAAHAGGDPGTPSRADRRAARRTRTSAGCSCARREHGALVARPGRQPPARGTATSRARTRWRPSRRPPRRTCCAPTASRTSPTSWSAASTTPSSTRAAPSRS